MSSTDEIPDASQPLPVESEANVQPHAAEARPIEAIEASAEKGESITSQTTEKLEESTNGADENVGEDYVEEVEETIEASSDGTQKVVRVRKKRRQPKFDATELRLLGRRDLCRRIADIAPSMLKTVKLRVLGRFLPSTRGLEEEDLTVAIKKNAEKMAEKNRILSAITAQDEDFQRGQVKPLLFNILLQEETYTCEENKLDEKVIEFEKDLVKRSKSFDLLDLKKQDNDRWHQYDTYRIVLEAAWANDNVISSDESRLLKVLRNHLSISFEEHCVISALLKRFPKEKCVLHTPDEINEARKELQREGLLWSYRDENNRNIDVIPFEIASLIRRHYVNLELQRTNFRRLTSQDAINAAEIRGVLESRGLSRYGNKAELIERLVASDIKPSELLAALDREKLSQMCASFGLKSSGAKAELGERLIEFFDDLTFEERISKDERELWYGNYELLASRAYAELRAKKVIGKDLEIEHYFEDATAFLFEARLHVACERSTKENRADGKLPLDNEQTILWDCKSVEGLVNLQDHLDSQFDGYLRKDRETGKQPLAFIVVGPGFTAQSVKLAHQYKARTNWDIALVTAEGLKYLADRWHATEPQKPFPVRLFNRTEVIDKERADFLLSLA